MTTSTPSAARPLSQGARRLSALLLLATLLATPAWADPAPRHGLAQRLDWRVHELEGELAALQRFSEQQHARMAQLQDRAEQAAAQARPWPRGLAAVAAAAGLLSAMVGWLAWPAPQAPGAAAGRPPPTGSARRKHWRAQ